MQYNQIKGASKIVSRSNYVISHPESLKNNWGNEFGNNNPIDLELGMGRGEFIINMAKKFPNRNFIGLEINDSQMVKAVEKLNMLKLPNLRLINADARLIADFFGKEIDTIYLTFSEPWPKKEDAKKRFSDVSYLRIYDRIFKKNKHIILKTDNKILFASSLESFSNYWYSFETVSLDLHHDERKIDNIMTDFEKVYYEEGRPIYYVDAKYE